MNVTGYSLGQSWTAVHTTFVESAPIEDAMAAIAEDVIYLAGQGRFFRTITLDFEEE